jgi:hypothetical protein
MALRAVNCGVIKMLCMAPQSIHQITTVFFGVASNAANAVASITPRPRFSAIAKCRRAHCKSKDSRIEYCAKTRKLQWLTAYFWADEEKFLAPILGVDGREFAGVKR